ncbi:MAG: low molecular weight phosphotyrosine protein phosphatase [Clostridia bacterium]|nr:low molecular weight phosphotyrosine protein phosphatase [Clostridia bacterium]
MTRILFVCHGNICRSPMAEFIFRRMAEERHAAHRFTVASAATSTEEIGWDGTGNPVYPPARAELKKHGIDCAGKRAVQLRREDYGKYDLLVGMDRENVRNMHRILGGDPEGKIRMLMDYTSRPGDVADPWYTGDFGVTYRDIADGCAALLEKLLKEGKG